MLNYIHICHTLSELSGKPDCLHISFLDPFQFSDRIQCSSYCLHAFSLNKLRTNLESLILFPIETFYSPAIYPTGNKSYTLYFHAALQFSKLFNGHSFDKEHFIHLFALIYLIKSNRLKLPDSSDQSNSTKVNGYACVSAVPFI